MPLRTESHTQSTELHIEQKHMVKTTSSVQSGSLHNLTRSHNLTATYNRIRSGCHQAQGTRQAAVGGAHTYTHRRTRRMTGAHARNTYPSGHPLSLVSHPPTPAASTHLPTYLLPPDPATTPLPWAQGSEPQRPGAQGGRRGLGNGAESVGKGLAGVREASGSVGMRSTLPPATPRSDSPVSWS